MTATPQVIIPPFNDSYCNHIKKLEAGETDINYQDFRFSFLESEQFKIAYEKGSELASLEKELRTQLKLRNNLEPIRIAKQMLSIDYTRMFAHQIAYSHGYIHDARHKAIQEGLLDSIVKKGNGQSRATAWQVIQISEEYFILNGLRAKVQIQRADLENGFYDIIEALVDDMTKTYYFETSKVFEGYKKLGLK